LIGGIVVVLSVVAFDRIRIDDPVGALSVHLVNGIWGTFALGLFYDNEIATSVAGLATGLTRGQQMLVQLKGIFWVGVFTLVVSLIVWHLLKATMGIRVSAEEEIDGLDFGEHGNHAYPDFVNPGSLPIPSTGTAYSMGTLGSSGSR
jgi:Amt family ammonium transporter